MQKSILYISTLLLVLSSCVTPKIHNALVSGNENNRTNLTQKEKEVLKLSDEVEELTLNVNLLKDKINNLENLDNLDSNIITNTLEKLENNNEQSSSSNIVVSNSSNMLEKVIKLYVSKKNIYLYKNRNRYFIINVNTMTNVISSIVQVYN